MSSVSLVSANSEELQNDSIGSGVKNLFIIYPKIWRFVTKTVPNWGTQWSVSSGVAFKCELILTQSSSIVSHSPTFVTYFALTSRPFRPSYVRQGQSWSTASANSWRNSRLIALDSNPKVNSGDTSVIVCDL